jgi:hypothetical protein
MYLHNIEKHYFISVEKFFYFFIAGSWKQPSIWRKPATEITGNWWKMEKCSRSNSNTI